VDKMQAILFCVMVVTACLAAGDLATKLRELRDAHTQHLLSTEEHAELRAQVLAHFAAAPSTPAPVRTEYGDTLIWSDEFTTFDLSKWKHEITLSGGGNWVIIKKVE
jgi:hypothetical protein